MASIKLTEKTKKRLRLDTLYRFIHRTAEIIVEESKTEGIIELAKVLIENDKKFLPLFPTQHAFVLKYIDKASKYSVTSYNLEYLLVTGIVTLRDEYEFYKVDCFNNEDLKSELNKFQLDIEDNPEFKVGVKRAQCLIESIINDVFVDPEATSKFKK